MCPLIYFCGYETESAIVANGTSPFIYVQTRRLDETVYFMYIYIYTYRYTYIYIHIYGSSEPACCTSSGDAALIRVMNDKR